MVMLMCDTTCPFRIHRRLCTESIRLFKELPHDEQESLICKSTHTKHPKGTILAHEGDSIDEVLIIREGRIKTCQSDMNGDEHILDILHEGQAIWHGMFLTDHTYRYDIVTLTDVTLCRISRENFMEVLQANPQTAIYLIEMLSSELQDANEKAYLLSIKKPVERVAAFLLFRDTRCIGSMIHMKLEDIAASISLRPETISRILSKMEKDGLIKRYGHGKIRVLDRDNMKKMYTV